jgi:hypothetical protein
VIEVAIAILVAVIAPVGAHRFVGGGPTTVNQADELCRRSYGDLARQGGRHVGQPITAFASFKEVCESEFVSLGGQRAQHFRRALRFHTRVGWHSWQNARTATNTTIAAIARASARARAAMMVIAPIKGQRRDDRRRGSMGDWAGVGDDEGTRRALIEQAASRLEPRITAKHRELGNRRLRFELG